MNNMSKFQYLIKRLDTFNIYEREFIHEIGKFELANENSICYFKNLFSKNKDKKQIFYIFNDEKIYKIMTNNEENEIFEFELFNKCDVKCIKFTSDYDGDYTLSFLLGEKEEILDSTKDSNLNHKSNYNEIIQDIFNYFK